MTFFCGIPQFLIFSHIANTFLDHMAVMAMKNKHRIDFVTNVDYICDVVYNRGNKLRAFIGFAGLDAQLLALERLKKNSDFDYECVGWSEIDKYAIKAHNALFPDLTDRNYGDICKIDWSQVPDFDFFTMSSPCQSFSVAGKRLGGDEGTGTPSSLLWECRRAIITKRPKYILFENVKNLLSKSFLPGFRKWQLELESYGYKNFVKLLNAKDYGVPQSRERVFMVSILDRDINYSFPAPKPLSYSLADYMTDDPYPDHYLSNERIEKFLARDDIKEYYNTHADKINKVIEIGNVYPNDEGWTSPQRGRVYSKKGLSPTLQVCMGGGLSPKILWERDGELFIRELSGKEFLRLMDIDEADADKIVNTLSCSRQRFVAGNSIVVGVLCGIFENLFSGVSCGAAVQTELSF